jgi:hypothetical protein
MLACFPPKPKKILDRTLIAAAVALILLILGITFSEIKAVKSAHLNATQ